MALQGAPSVVTLALVWFIPESPRWYIAHGNQDKAKELLVKYHGNGDPNSRIVELEMRQMIEGIDTNGADKRWWDFGSLFKTRADRVSGSAPYSEMVFADATSTVCSSSVWSQSSVNLIFHLHRTISPSW
jgi:hypothetical protein